MQCTSRISFQRTEDSLPAFTPWATMGFAASFILRRTVYNTDNVWHVGKRYICKQSPYWTKFLVKIFITFTSPNKNIYLCIAALYINTAVSLKSNITKFIVRWTGQYFDLHSFVGRSKGTLFAVNNLKRDSTLRYSHISWVNKANPEKIWTTIWIFWISIAHIKAYFPAIRP